LVDEDYPQTLKNTYRPPFVLFYSGNKDSLTKSNLIYLVGENKFGLDDKTTIVASLSRVAISDDLVLYNCEDTEKIASALCEKLVITEEHETKKASISVCFALKDNKDIYVAPTREKSFANDLIKQGANLIDSIEDLA
jgi:predicted Rossmann fold nucleotide-binding protein DprA/Smf involved in DNA uptake